ncbi:MAG TPA: aromatic ring-opening dioxygenase subunit LigB, partial [Thermomicrobiales bacterium]|nr:aromatic ring-opening dioxygenase subunit LigB [Thermomicrobiales bacterium]
MPLVAAQIAPHGWDIVDGFTEDAGGALTTRASMKQVGKLFHDAGVEVIVLVGPHGTRVEGAMALTNVARGAGTMIRQGLTWETNVPVDRQFVLEIDRRAQAAGVNTALVGYAGNRADQSAIVMDWGAIVPLTFNGHPENRVGFGTVLGGVPEDDHGPQVVLITPSRAMGRQAMVDFGRVLGEAFRDDPRKIGFIASCDWGHAHTADGPYGFHPDAAKVDAKVVDAIEKNELLSLI